MIVDGIELSPRDSLSWGLVQRDELGLWTSIIGSFLLLEVASCNKALIYNRYTQEASEDELPRPADLGILAVILGTFGAVWTLDVVVRRYNQVKESNATGETDYNLEAPALVVLSAILGVISIALLFKAALIKSGEAVPRIVIL